MDKTSKIILSGFGGQGLMFLGKLLAEAAVKEDKFTTWFPAYGAEVRGGTAYCGVIISDREIASPLVVNPNILVAMNQPSLDKFLPIVEKGAVVFANSSLINNEIKSSGIKIILGPFTDIAVKLGEVRIANMVALGALLETTKIVKLETVLEVLDEMIPSSRKFIMETNKQAISEGRKLIK